MKPIIENWYCLAENSESRRKPASQQAKWRRLAWLRQPGVAGIIGERSGNPASQSKTGEENDVMWLSSISQP